AAELQDGEWSRAQLLCAIALLQTEKLDAGHPLDRGEFSERKRPLPIGRILWIPLPGKTDPECVRGAQLALPVSHECRVREDVGDVRRHRGQRRAEDTR